MDKIKCINCTKFFKPRKGLEEKQLVCSERCLVDYFDKRIGHTKALARSYARSMGYRSMGEVRFASRLNTWNIPFEYESETFEYWHKPSKYTPDFIIRNGSSKIYFEYKGKLDQDDRRKLRAVKRSNPKLDLRLIFEQPNNFIRKRRNKTEKVSRYWEWAVSNGFKWYSVQDFEKLKKAIKGGRKKCRTTTAKSATTTSKHRSGTTK